MSDDHDHATRGRLATVLSLAVATVIIIAFRAWAFSLPLETDEANYAYIGARLLVGDRLYLDVWDHQPPGAFALFATAAAVAGNPVAGNPVAGNPVTGNPVPENDDATYRVLAIAASLMSVLLVHRIVKIGLGATCANFGAIFFAIASSDPAIGGDGCNREVFMNPLGLAAVLFLFRRPDAAPTFRGITIAGAFLGLSSTLKTVAAAQWLTLAIWLVVDAFISRPNLLPVSSPPQKLKNAFVRVAAFAAAPALIWIAIFAYFAATHRFSEFWDAAFAFNLDYASVDHSFIAKLGGFFTPTFNVFAFNPAFWFIAAAAVVAIFLLPFLRPSRFNGLTLAYVAGSYIAVCLPGHFWHHYYLLMIPPAILAITTTLQQWVPLASPRRREAGAVPHPPANNLAIPILLTVLFVITTPMAYNLLKQNALDAFPDVRYRSRQAWAKAQGRRANAVTEPSDTIFVWGNDAGIYYYANRMSASKFTMINSLRKSFPNHKERRDELLAEIDAAKPRLVLVVEPEFPELKQFLTRHYFLVGADPSESGEGQDMIALMRKDAPLSQIDWQWPPQ